MENSLFIFGSIFAVYLLGLIAFFSSSIIIVSFILLIILILLLIKNYIKPINAFILYLIFAFALVNCYIQIKSEDDLSNIAPINNITIKGIVSSIPEFKSDNKLSFFLDVESVKNKNLSQNIKAKTIVNIILNDRNKKELNRLKIGNTIELEGNLKLPFKPISPSQFNYAAYLKTKKIFTTFTSKDDTAKITYEKKNLKWKFLQKINDTRENIIEQHKRYIKSPGIELLGGVVFGDDAVNPPEELQQSFLYSGLTHLLAASGLNVGLIFALSYFLLNILRIPINTNFIICMILILLYLCMTGFPPSIVRAGIMIEFVILAKLFRNKVDTLSVVSLSALLMLIYNPYYLKDIGFQLSFIVTFGLIISTSVFIKLFKNLPDIIKGEIAAPIISQIWVCPIQMFYFNSFTLYSIIANIIVIPFISIIGFLGFLSSFLAIIPVISSQLIKILDFILNPLLSITINISKFFSMLPHSMIDTFQPSILQIVIYYILLILIIKGFQENFNIKYIKTSIILLSFILIISFFPVNNKNLEILTFNQFQSDCILIKTPKNKYILISSEDNNDNSKYYKKQKASVIEYLKDKGIRNIEFIVSSSDFINIDILNKFHVKRLIVKDNINKDYIKSLEIKNPLKRDKVQLEYAKNNLVIYEENGLKFTVYNNSLKTNNDKDKIVTLLENKNKKYLFIYDITDNSYENIKKFLPKNVDLLKIIDNPQNSNLQERIITYLKPKHIIITSTSMNKFSYLPRKEILSLIDQNNIKICNKAYYNTVKIINHNNSNDDIFAYDKEKQKFSKI